jgi:hypothetical protein
MNRKFSLALSVVALSAALGGCATNETARATSVTVTPPVNPLDELRSVAIETRDELRLLAKVNDAVSAPSLTKEQHAQMYFQSTHVPHGFERIASFSYTGPVSTTAEALAKVAGYKFRKPSVNLPNEPWATINIVNQPLNDALRELGVQSGSAIRVEVLEQANVINLVYKQ